MKRAIFSTVLLMGSVLSFSQSHFTPVWSGNGLNHMNFNVNTATIDGVACAAGDEIAVFDGPLCVGVQVVTVPGNIIYIAVSKDDPITPDVTDGFTAGHTATFRIWDASEAEEIVDATVTLISGTLEFADGASTWLNLAAITTCIPPAAPIIGPITQPTCLVNTGSVVLNGLPSTGSWTLTRMPGNTATTGSGSSFTVTSLPADTFTFTVASIAGCISLPSSTVIIQIPPTVPAQPVAGIVTQPDCQTATGSVVLSGLPATGNWTLTRSPGGIATPGSGTSLAISGLPANQTYTYTVTNPEGCTSLPSAGIVVNAQPLTPAAPIPGTITQPSCQTPSGSVVLNGLPSGGSWTLTRMPGNITTTGSGLSFTITGLPADTFTYTVTNSAGCISLPTADIVIQNPPNVPTIPVPGTITQPNCQNGTGSVVLTGLPATGNWTIHRSPGTITYAGSGTEYTVTGLPDGRTFRFSVTNAAGCSSGLSTGVVINEQPATPAPPNHGTITQPTCQLNTGSVVLTGLPSNGSWTLIRTPGGNSTTGSGSSYTVTGLPADTFTFTVTNTAGCISLPSAGIIITNPPSVPTPPVPGTITQPDCQTGTGSVMLSGLPGAGNWTIIRTPGSNVYTGSGTGYTVTGLPDAVTYTFTVTNAAGCTSGPSAGVDIHEQPHSPPAPTRGTVTQPDCQTNTGSVVLTGLPSVGQWTLTRMPGSVAVTGSGTSYTIANLPAGSYTFTVTNSAGCTSSPTSGILIQNPPSLPTQPVPGNITQPDCQTGTGSVVLSGLPASGIWTLTRTPGGNVYTGSGTQFTVTGLPDGRTFTFKVTNADGCTSLSSTGVVIQDQPTAPAAPTAGTIVQPTCQTGTGSVVLSGLPSSGGWTLTRTPGGNTFVGSGSSYVVSGLPAGNTYTFRITNTAGCTSPSSAGIVINSHGGVPNPPSVGNITQPTCAVSTGSVVLTSLPAQGDWTITRSPGGIPVNGSGSSITLPELAAGTYTFTVTNTSGCTSGPSTQVTIQARSLPIQPAVGNITQPTCATSTGSVVLSGLPATGTWTLIRNPGGFITSGTGTGTTVSGLIAGTHTFTVRGTSGCTSAPSENVIINSQPLSTAPVTGKVTQPNCQLNTGSIALSGLPSSGTWTVTRIPGGTTTRGSGTKATVNGVPPGLYQFTVTNESECVSPPSAQVFVQEVTDKPTTPVIGNITQPSCTSSTGEVLLVGLPGTGSWTLTRVPGNNTYTGTGSNYAVKGLAASATYTFTLTNSSGCQSAASAPVAISSRPTVPGTPTAGSIVQPTCAEPGGSVILLGLPSGNWTLATYPGGAITPGNGTAFMVNELNPGSYSFSVTHSSGCTSQVSSPVVIQAPPTAPASPAIGTITQPTCSLNTGSVQITGLPSGNWILKRFPGGSATSGSGTSTTISGLNPGSHSFTVTNSGGCSSVNSAVVVIVEDPLHPSPPVPANVTQPSCGTTTGSITFTGLPPTGTWTLVSSPGGTIGKGNGSSATISNVEQGSYTYYVTNASGCTSGYSAEVIITPQPPTPETPLVDDIQYPTVYGPGSLVLKRLPTNGGWLVTRDPGGFLTAGTGDTLFVDNLSEGTYRFTVTNDQGCNSPEVTVTLPIVTGLPVENNTSLRLYPNPVKDHFTVDLDHETIRALIELTSLQGNLIFSSEHEIYNGKLEVNVDELPPGMYLLRITAGDAVSQFRFVKE